MPLLRRLVVVATPFGFDAHAARVQRLSEIRHEAVAAMNLGAVRPFPLDDVHGFEDAHPMVSLPCPIAERSDLRAVDPSAARPPR